MSLSQEFLDKGIVKFPVERPDSLDIIRSICINECGSLNTLHKRTNDNALPLNDLRLNIIKKLNHFIGLQRRYLSLAQSAIEEIVGNELVMQRNINLSIQLPGDSSSLLPVHCDTWSGDSPYEVVLWVPLVDCYGTKSMYFCDKKKSEEIHPYINTFEDAEALYKAIENDVKFIDVKYGECLIFTQNIMHGNRVNTTDETRWSMNCRFKSLFSPYADKKLGEFFAPVEVRAATKLGIQYELPRI